MMTREFQSLHGKCGVTSGKTRNDLLQNSMRESFIVDGKIVAASKQLLEWLKRDLGLGNVRANFVIAYLRLWIHDPKVIE